MASPPLGPLYTPLDRSKKEVRLLSPAPYDTDIFSICECTMVKAYLSKDPPPRFNALSYEWDYPISVPKVGTAVLVNGHRVQVTKNLAAFLTRYRYICSPSYGRATKTKRVRYSLTGSGPPYVACSDTRIGGGRGSSRKSF